MYLLPCQLGYRSWKPLTPQPRQLTEHNQHLSQKHATNLQNNRVFSNILKHTAEFSKNPSVCPERCLGQNNKVHTDGVSFTLKVNVLIKVPSLATQRTGWYGWLSLGDDCCDVTLNKSNLGGKGLFCLHFRITIHRWRKWVQEFRQEAGDRSCCWGHEGVLFTGLPSARSVCFLM